MGVKIAHIEYHLPGNVLTNEMLREMHPDWDIDKVAIKSGVNKRHIASETETALDLSIRACQKFFEQSGLEASSVGGVIYCTQSPDHIMPSNAFLIQRHFNLPNRILAFDYNLACSGYIYGLAIARGLMETNVADNILLINADTYSKLIGRNDRSTRILFGDGAAVTLLQKDTSHTSNILDLLLESAGENYDSFYIPAGGSRKPFTPTTKLEVPDLSGNLRSDENIHMNGFAVWKFISKTVPQQINRLLKRNQMTVDDVDLFVFHQASKLTLDSLIKTLEIPRNKAFMNLEEIGNTVSSSIPIALKDAIIAGRLKRGDTILLSGFGVGLSWGTVLLKF